MQREFQQALDRLGADAHLWNDFIALCDCGGRLAGTGSEKAALRFVQARLEEIGAGTVRSEAVSFAGWRCTGASLTLGEDRVPLACKPLIGAQPTPAAGVTAEVIDLGRGTPDQFALRGREIAGRIVLVRHEYMFASGHLHRRRKYGWAMERGACGFIIANPLRGAGVVSGSSGRGGETGIPAVATDAESAARLAPAGAQLPRVTLTIAAEDSPAETTVEILEIPGKTDRWVVLSAHVDGHDLAESAMDNASGVAVALAVARTLAPLVGRCRRGLRVCLFSAEEWALAGSRQYLDRMGNEARRAIALNLNVDTVGGDSQLTALTSEFPMLDGFVEDTAAAVGVAAGIYRPLMANSDHANFARHGIPALRLVAGFDRPASKIRHVLTAGDTRGNVAPAELRNAGLLTGALLWRALNAEDAVLAGLAART
jgi:aminopeptidase YwaD